MKKGIKVTWQVQGAPARGEGEVLTDEENGYVLVAVDCYGWHEVAMGFRHVAQFPVSMLKEQLVGAVPVASLPEAAQPIGASASQPAASLSKPIGT